MVIELSMYPRVSSVALQIIVSFLYDPFFFFSTKTVYFTDDELSSTAS